MANTLFQKYNNQTPQMPQNNQGISDDLARQLYNSNPQFKNFVDKNKSKGPQAMLKEMGVDSNQLLQYARKILG